MNATDTQKESFVATQSRMVVELTELYNRRGGNLWDVFYNFMPEGKIRAWVKQFPWVEKYLPLSDVRQVFVSAIDPRMIRRSIGSEKPSGCYGTWECGGYEYDFKEYAFLLDEEGNEVTKTVPQPPTKHKKYIFWGPEIETPQDSVEVGKGGVPTRRTIVGLLSQLGDEANRVSFILSYDMWTRTAIMYHRPKGADLFKWLIDELDEKTNSQT